MCPALCLPHHKESDSHKLKLNPGTRGRRLCWVDPSQLLVFVGFDLALACEEGSHSVAQVKLIAQLSCPECIGMCQHGEAWWVGPRLHGILREMSQLP